jgi:hypothetical protein
VVNPRPLEAALKELRHLGRNGPAAPSGHAATS